MGDKYYMILKIKCPNCDENLILNIQGNKVVSVLVDTTSYVSDKDIKDVLKKNNIEFG